MLNLLISIISASFGEINEKAKEANYQERARIISENGYLIPSWVKNKQDDFDKLVVIATEVADADNEPSKIVDKVKNIEESLIQFVIIFNFTLLLYRKMKWFKNKKNWKIS